MKAWAVVSLLTLGAAACGTAATTSARSTGVPSSDAPCTTLPGSPGPVPFTPYADVTLSPRINLSATSCSTGTRQFTVAFFQGPAAGQGCTPNLGGSPYQDAALRSDLGALRRLGGDAIGSFGGSAGVELAQACGSGSQLEAAYQSVVDYYDFRQIDFDIEGSASGQRSVDDRRSAAIATLQKKEAAAGHPLKVSLTVPVVPSGLPSPALDVVRSAVNAGVQLSIVNILAMDYGDGAAPNPSGRMGQYAIDSATATEAQLATVFGQDTPAQVWGMLGVTPMIGQNDTKDEVFSLTDANLVTSWARSRGLGRLAMWSTNRDMPCAGGADEAGSSCSGVQEPQWAYSRVFLAA